MKKKNIAITRHLVKNESVEQLRLFAPEGVN